MQLIIVTGISGSGKSLAINVLEDAGYFCIDNLPVRYVLEVALSLEQEGHPKVAMSIDVRVGTSLTGLRDAVRQLRKLGHDVKVLFLNARTDALVQRYSETRRRHPLTLPGRNAAAGTTRPPTTEGTPAHDPADPQLAPTLEESIERERELMAEIEDIGTAIDTSGLAGSGTLTPEEHRAYMRLAVAATTDLYKANRWVRYVAVFQNWLRPAGASFDHLHKQLVGIDERGVSAALELQRVRANPNLYNEMGVDYAAYSGLLVASNEHAVAFAGFGHRYPTLEVYSTSATCAPWLMSREEVDAVADLVHALHAATGADVPSNEEWHHKPIDVDQPMPWHITLKWRVSTLAGFEGGTKIYLNTIDPWTLHDRVVGRLEDLRADRLIAPMSVGEECPTTPNRLMYCLDARHCAASAHQRNPVQPDQPLLLPQDRHPDCRGGRVLHHR